MRAWQVPMLLGGALFTGGVTWFAWMRVPIWRRMSRADFQADFAESIRRADRVQPALLVATLAAAVAFALQAADGARAFAIAGIVGLMATLVGSGTLLVPLQRRMMRPGTLATREDLDAMRRRWLGGHVARTALALASFTLLVVAASS